MSAGAARGFPALVGVVVGILILVFGTQWIWLALAALVVGYASRRLGAQQIRTHPTVGFVLIELWILTAIAVMALATAGILWLTVHSPEWFGAAPDNKKEAVSGALVGAVTAYLAMLYTEDISNLGPWRHPGPGLRQREPGRPRPVGQLRLRLAQRHRRRRHGPSDEIAPYSSPLGNAKWSLMAPGGVGGGLPARDILSSIWKKGTGEPVRRPGRDLDGRPARGRSRGAPARPGSRPAGGGRPVAGDRRSQRVLWPNSPTCAGRLDVAQATTR